MGKPAERPGHKTIGPVLRGWQPVADKEVTSRPVCLFFYYVGNIDEVDIDGISKNVPCEESPPAGDI